MSVPVVPSWFDQPQSEVRAAFAADRLAHGLLIHEDPGAGGLELARWIAQFVNCRVAGPRPCGECRECRWTAADQHPDVRLLAPEGESTQILIQSVRDLAAELSLTAHADGYKIAIVAPADAMNPFAANALLKTLEEPPARTLVLLVTGQPSRLLPTLRSRCSRLRLPGPGRAIAAEWLRKVRGEGAWEEALAATGQGPFALLDTDPAVLATLRAETLASLEQIGRGQMQPPAIADRWARGDLATRLACLESWITDRILDAAGAARESSEMRDATHLPGGGLHSNICRLFELSDAVRDMRKLAHTSINKTLAVESLLWRWARQ